jgi:hypothetical protein
MRDIVELVREWWAFRTGPMERRLLAELNSNIQDPEWWTRRRRVHPLRCHAYAPKVQAVETVIMEDPELVSRRQSILAKWESARYILASTNQEMAS